jgi:hypothetical protein
MTVAADVALASRASSEELAKRTARRLDELLESAIHVAALPASAARAHARGRAWPTCRSCARPI